MEKSTPSFLILEAIQSFPFPNPKKTQKSKAKTVLQNLFCGVNGCYDFILMFIQLQKNLDIRLVELIKEEIVGNHRSILYFFTKNSNSLPYPKNWLAMESVVEKIKKYLIRNPEAAIPLLAVMEVSAFYSMPVLGQLSAKLKNPNLFYTESHSTLDEQHSKDMLQLIDELNPPAQILKESIRLVLEWKRAIFEINQN